MFDLDKLMKKKSSSNNSFMSISINGRRVEVSGKNISIQNGDIYVDGKPLGEDVGRNVTIIIEGDCGNIDTTGSVEVRGSCRNIDCGGSASIGGDVEGNVDAGGSVTCGNINGDVDAGGSIRCKGVGR